MAERTVEMWCDSATADHEMECAEKIVIYSAREDLERDRPYVIGSKDYAPRRLTVTIHDREA